MVALCTIALRFTPRPSAVGLIQLVTRWISVSRFWPRPVLQTLVPRSGSGVIERSLSRGEGGHASLSERPGLFSFMETGCSSELWVSVTAPLGQVPSVILVLEMSSSYQGLGRAHCRVGL